MQTITRFLLPVFSSPGIRCIHQRRPGGSSHIYCCAKDLAGWIENLGGKVRYLDYGQFADPDFYYDAETRDRYYALQVLPYLVGMNVYNLEVRRFLIRIVIQATEAANRLVAADGYSNTEISEELTEGLPAP